jgi:hypothetical protein
MSDPTPPSRDAPAPAAPAPGPNSATQPDTPAVAPGDPTQTLRPPAPDPSATGERTAVQQLDDVIANRLRHAGPPPAAGYRLARKLGEGTYGTVWLAEDRAGVRVAIKFFAHGTGQQWQMLQDEVRSLARLDTTFGIVQLKEVEPEADPPYFVMSYAEGGSLQQKLAGGPLPLPEALRYFTEIARALAFVHAKGIRHCDLKPANILLNQHGQPLIADFGQAHLSDDAAPALGTFFYMAPEQAEPGLQIPDARWDIYGLGAIFYALLTGDPPHKDDALADELRQTVQLHHRLRIYRERIRVLPQPADHRQVRGVDKMLAGVLDRCLELDPAHRLRDAGAVLDALETRRRQRRQRPMLLFGTLAPLLVLALMLAVGSLAARDAIAEARAGLTRQLLDSDLVTARLAAKVLEDKLHDGVTLIEDFAAAGTEPRLAGVVAPVVAKRASGAALTPADLRPLYDWLTTRAGWRRCREYYSTLSVVDAGGSVLARVECDEDAQAPDPAQQVELLRQNYAWRDWFNGLGDQHGRHGGHFAPIATTHISHPYVGEQMNRGRKLVNVSAPIPGPGGAPLGVVIGHIDWDRLQGWLGELRGWMEDVRAGGGFPVVVNDRGHCLTHRDAALIELKPGEVPRAFYDPDWVRRLRAGSADDYTDPVTGRPQLAGFAPARPSPLSGQQWAVLIEHDPAAVLQPVVELKERMVAIGLGILAIMGVLIGGLWGWLVWTLRREERLAHG